VLDERRLNSRCRSKLVRKYGGGKDKGVLLLCSSTTIDSWWQPKDESRGQYNTMRDTRSASECMVEAGTRWRKLAAAKREREGRNALGKAEKRWTII
jgi:hypothetical protein